MKSKLIFSGNDSKKFWKRINKLHKKYPSIFWALYILGCKCQELEAEVVRLERLIEETKEYVER